MTAVVVPGRRRPQLDELEGLVAETVARFGRLDCLVNNAGWHPPHRPVDGFTVADFRLLLELNVVSLFALCRMALPHLRTTHGSIVNIASLVGTMGQRHATTYVATKGAVLAFTKALALDEAPHGRARRVVELEARPDRPRPGGVQLDRGVAGQRRERVLPLGADAQR